MEVPIGDSLHQRHGDRDAEFARIHWLTIRRWRETLSEKEKIAGVL